MDAKKNDATGNRAVTGASRPTARHVATEPAPDPTAELWCEGLNVAGVSFDGAGRSRACWACRSAGFPGSSVVVGSGRCIQQRAGIALMAVSAALNEAAQGHRWGSRNRSRRAECTSRPGTQNSLV